MNVAAPARDARLEALLLRESISQFYYREADMLDHKQLNDWLALFTDDAKYTLPIQRNVKHGNWDQETRLTAVDVAWIADNREALELRVEQMLTGVHWAEEPVSRFAHLVTNVRVLDFDGTTAHVRSRFVVKRNRNETENDVFIGIREDYLVQSGDDDWMVRERIVFLQESVLLAKNISLFF